MESFIAGRLSWLMYLCHVSWMIYVCVVVCLGNLLCSWVAGRCTLAARVDRVVHSLVWGRDLSPLCSFACTADALRI